MSGKSTLLRTVGVNAVLAQAGAPGPRPRRLRLTPLAVGATIRIQDSLQARHVALLRRDHARCGRSSIWRRGPLAAPLPARRDPPRHQLARPARSAPRRSCAALLGRGAIGLVTTHDLALAEIADELDGARRERPLRGPPRGRQDALRLPMRPGVVTKSNALELMRAVGLEV